MRIAQGTLIAALLATAIAAPAEAWKGTYTGQLQAGPALAGSGTAWADGHWQSGPMQVRRAPLDGAPATLFTIDRRAACDRVEDLAASADRVAVLVFRGPADGSCFNEGLDVIVSDGSASGKTLETTAGGFSQCAASGMDVDGGVVAVARYNCEKLPVMLHDVAKGTSEPLGLELPIGVNPVDVRIAGRYVAVVTEALSGAQRFEVVVWDHEAGEVAYRVDADAFRAGADYAVATHRLELQADGRVLYGVTVIDGGTRVRYGWATAADPVLRLIPGDFAQSNGRHGFAGDLVALQRGSGHPGIFGTDGALKNQFSLRPTAGTVDFDGSRLTWQDWEYVYNEPYPFTPPPEAPPATPAKPPVQPRPANVPAALIAGLKATMKAKSLKAFSGTAADADGDLALVRLGLARLAGKKCETLQRSGALKRSPRVGGKCVPTVFQDASGTATWKLRLRKRLPRGRYVLYVQAVDAAGHAQMTFTKAAGSLRTFTLK